MSCATGPCVPAEFCTPPNFAILFPQLVGATGPTGPSGGPVGATGPTGASFVVPSTPVIAVGTGAGTGATVTISGNDAGFHVTLTTGTSPNTSSNLFVVTFGAGNTPVPAVVWVPTNAAACAAAGLATMYAVATQTTITMPSPSNVALPASTVFTYDFITNSA